MEPIWASLPNIVIGMNGGNSTGLFLPNTKICPCIGLVVNQLSWLIQLSDISAKGAKLFTATFDGIQQIKSQIDVITWMFPKSRIYGY